MTPAAARAALAARGDAARGARMAACHKTDRAVLGVPGDVLDAMVRDWRRAMAQPARLALAQALWDDGTFEARIAAAKLLTQSRIPADAAVWQMLVAWVPQFDGWAIADAASGALARRLTADPARLDTVGAWAGSEALWVRRAALVSTLPWARMRHPSPADHAARIRVLGWAAACVPDRRRFIQKAVATWLRELSRKAPGEVRAFLEGPGATLAPFAAREAARLLPAT